MRKVTRQLVNRGVGPFKKIINREEATPIQEEKSNEENKKKRNRA